MKNISPPKVEIALPEFLKKFGKKINFTVVCYSLIFISFVTFVLSIVLYVRVLPTKLSDSQEKTYNTMKTFFGNSFYDPAYTILTCPKTQLSIHDKNDKTLLSFKPFTSTTIDDDNNIKYNIDLPFLSLPTNEKNLFFQYLNDKWTVGA